MLTSLWNLSESLLWNAFFKFFFMTAGTFARLVIRGAISNRDPCKVTLTVINVAYERLPSTVQTTSHSHEQTATALFTGWLFLATSATAVVAPFYLKNKHKYTLLFVGWFRNKILWNRQTSSMGLRVVNAACAIVAAHLPSTHVWQPSQTTGK